MNIAFIRSCRAGLFLWYCLSVQLGLAQSPAPLKLQPHKVKLARKLYWEGIRTHNPVQVAEGYYEYGKLYAAASDYLNAHRWFIKSLRLIEPKGDSYELARLHVRLSDLAVLQIDYTQAWQHAHTALAVARRCRSDRGTIRACAVLARIHGRNWLAEAPASSNWPASNVDSALYYFRQVEKLAYRLNDPMEVAQVKQSIGGQLIDRNDRRALVYLTDALTIATQQQSPDRLGMMVNIARAYLRFNQPKQAWPYIEMAQKLADKSYPNVSYWEYSIEGVLIDFYRTTGNWQQVALHAETYHQWEKRDIIADREGAISKLHLDYQTSKKELVFAVQEKELFLQTENLLMHKRLVLITSVLLLLTIGVSILFFRLYRKNRRTSAHNAELVKEQNHRVKNNLQALSSLLNLQASELVDERAKAAIGESQLRVEAMAIVHRRLYDGDKLARVNLAEFIAELVEVVLQTFGYGDIEPVYDLEPIDLSADQALAVGLILNELTTNACKYAFPEVSVPVFRVACCRYQNKIVLTVSDNGPGFLVDAGGADVLSKPPITFGMRLIQVQVHQLRGTYHISANEETTFTLTFAV